MRMLLLLVGWLFSIALYAKDLPLHRLTLPNHFKISIYTQNVPDARQMALSPSGIVYVGTRWLGKVYAVLPDNEKPNRTRVITIASDLNMPNGVAFYNNDLYVAERHRILRFDDIEKHLTHPPKPVVIYEGLPNEVRHGWRYISIAPDGKLYIAIGMPCNSCTRPDARFATIMRMNVNGSEAEIFAKGIRNSVGFDWDPRNNHLWFTDNGRDELGDDIPPDKLNVAPVKGLNFGFPYYNGKNLPDPHFGKGHAQSEFTMPTYALPAHVAPLGVRFYRGQQFPERGGLVFIAEHGSWNRSEKTGYQVVSANVDENNKIKNLRPFITGWLQKETQTYWGRPVDIIELADGSLLISDDYAGAIYRVSYTQ